jgi:hypothetical protein
MLVFAACDANPGGKENFFFNMTAANNTIGANGDMVFHYYISVRKI